MGAGSRGEHEDISFPEQRVQQEFDRRGEEHSSHEEQHVQKYGAKRGFLLEEEQVCEPCTGGRRLGGAMGHEARKVSWGQTVERMTPGPSKEKRSRKWDRPQKWGLTHRNGVSDFLGWTGGHQGNQRGHIYKPSGPDWLLMLWF